MIIANSEITMMSRRSYQEQSINEERLQQWVDPRQAVSSSSSPAAMRPAPDRVEISTAAAEAGQVKGSEDEDSLLQLSMKDKLKITMVQMLLEKLTGKRFRFVLPKELKTRQPDNLKLPGSANGGQPAAARVGWGLRYDARSYYHEAEQTSFRARGVVKTADGQEINISLQLNMSRTFTVQSEIHFQAGDARAVDPLVINYQGHAASLTQRTYAFDLNSDGILEQIAFVRPGSGFLALDKNGDGIINNGSELFGPASGNGFAELALYDEDGNGWIDEGDSVYARLKIWSKDEEGHDRLISVSDAGVGAIMLGNIDTPFTITNSSNEAQGFVRHSSIFLRENGSAGTVQQIDLVV